MIRQLWGIFLLYVVYGIIRKISSAVETISYKKKIIFNTVWEDPRLDKEALKINRHDTVLTISSAGCNALALLLENPKHIYLVDRNPCQNALVEIKLAAIKNLDYNSFWKLFGEGLLPNFSNHYYPLIRKDLSPASQKFWDSKAFYFDGTGLKRSFYWRGTCGTVAWLLSWYVRVIPGLHGAIQALLEAKNVEEQKLIYHKFVAPRLWNRMINKLVKSEVYLSWTGIPLPQQQLLARTAGSHASIGLWIKEQLEIVCTEIPIHENYFWRVYINGSYSKNCCPDYLKQENFEKLKASVDKISISTQTITEFLESNPDVKISTYILLDHMDWMADKPDILSEEWNAILSNATEKCKFLWRSAAHNADFVLGTKVMFKDKQSHLQELLEMDVDTAQQLHPLDRVHTYTSLHVGMLKS